MPTANRLTASRRRLPFATPTPPVEVVELWGKGFWVLLPFTLQMALVVITGYVLGA